MRIAIAQINTKAGDFDAIAERMRLYAHTSVQKDVELLVFPMAALTGPLPVDQAQRTNHQRDLFATLEDLAQDVPCTCLVPTVFEMDGETYHEVMLLQAGSITPLRTRAYVSSDHVGEGERAQGERHAGTHPLTTFELGGLRFGLAMTYEELDDLVDGDPELDVVVFVSDYNYALDDASSALGASLSENRFRADAVAIDAWLVAVGSLGGYDLQVYTGSSFVMAPSGELMASAPAFEETLLITEVGTVLEGHEERLHTLALEPELYNRSLHMWEALSLALRDYVGKQGRTEVALVLDGTLASSVLAVLSSDALGPTHVHAVLDDAPTNAQVAVGAAVADALRLSCDKSVVNCSPAGASAQLHEDLLQVCLADVARANDAVTLSAFDKTALALEVQTGRVSAAELMALGDVYRSDLIELAHMRNTISPVIPPEAFANYEVPAIEGLEEAESTRELRLKRIDVTLANYIEWERPLVDVVARQGNPALTEAILRRLAAHDVARALYSTCLIVSTRPLFMVHTPLAYAWSDSTNNEEQRRQGDRAIAKTRAALGVDEQKSGNAPDYSRLLEGLQFELHSGNLPEGVDQSTVEGALGELTELLQGLVQDGEQQPFIEGPFGPLTWGNPFSEN